VDLVGGEGQGGRREQWAELTDGASAGERGEVAGRRRRARGPRVVGDDGRELALIGLAREARSRAASSWPGRARGRRLSVSRPPR
jgi:hypothetical protein